jgi:hypothetical protein
MDAVLFLRQACLFQSLELQGAGDVRGLRRGLRPRLWSTRGDRARGQEVSLFGIGPAGILIAFDPDSYLIQLAQWVNQWTSNIAGDAWQKHGEEVAALVRNSGFASVELNPVRYWFKTLLIVADTAPEP